MLAETDYIDLEHIHTIISKLMFIRWAYEGETRLLKVQAEAKILDPTPISIFCLKGNYAEWRESLSTWFV